MTRGYSLEQDLRLLINNPKYSDIEILCGDEEKLHACRAILAARSEVFDKLFYNGMKETYERQISFPKINASGMKIILEYVYTGSIKEESLTKDNIVEAFHAADYFLLSDLQDFIMKTIKNSDYYITNYSPELLSKVADIIPLSEDNILLNLLIESVAIMPLNAIEFGRLSIPGLQYLLSCTHKKEKPFATPEYEVFRYSAILSAKQVSNDSCKILMEVLPTLEQLKNSIQVEKKFIPNHQKIAKELESLIKFIDFVQVRGQILADIIEPLRIVPAEVILNVYRQKVRSNNTDSNGIRGIPQIIYNFSECDHVWDDSLHGSKLIIANGGKVVQAPNNCGSYQSVRAKMILDNKGVFEWDVIIEKTCTWAWVGVCAPEHFNYEIFAGYQSAGWVLGSSGYCYNKSSNIPNYCPGFGDGAKITVHLDMNKRTLAFTVNGTKYPEISRWNNLPSKLYPVASLYYPGRLRIQPYRKFLI